MKLPRRQQVTLDALIEGRGLDFSQLVEISGLDPARDFRGSDLSKVDFGTADLRAFDLQGADLRGSDLSRARVSRRVIEGASLRGAKLPKSWRFSPVQLEAISVVREHLAKGASRALVSMPLGTGVSTVIEELMESLSEADAKVGMVLFSSRASADQFRMRLQERNPGFAAPLSQLRVGAAAATWYIGTYREVDELRGDARADIHGVIKAGFTHVILAEADHPAWKLVEPVLKQASKAVQVAFVTRPPELQTRPIEDYFGPNLVYALSASEAHRFGLLRPFRIIERDILGLGGASSAQRLRRNAERAARDLLAFLRRHKLLESKTLVLCSTLVESERLVKYLNDHGPDVARPEAHQFAERPRTQRDLRAVLAQHGEAPFVVSCSPASAGEAFEASPDIIALVARDISGRTRQLWESARSAGGADDELLVLDYTGRLTQQKLVAGARSDESTRLDAAIAREQRRRDRARLPSEVAAAELRLAALMRRRDLIADD